MLQINDYVSTYISYVDLKHPLTKEMIDELISLLPKEESKLEKNNNLLIIDAGAVAGLYHLLACIRFSIKAFEQKTNIANSINTEILLYLSGYRQISKAISKVGLSKKTKSLLMIQIINQKKADNKELIFYDFSNILNKCKILINTYLADISTFKIKDEKRILDNLEITEGVIQLIIEENNPEYTREKAIEKLAIEKSALLNIIK
ncbi:MAG: hypothetical protein FK734_07065 [Asgard group archaeon]|nr:hypothetical protein [Asgard group archaeon]